jgi:hypothetical protein
MLAANSLLDVRTAAAQSAMRWTPHNADARPDAASFLASALGADSADAYLRVALSDAHRQCALTANGSISREAALSRVASITEGAISKLWGSAEHGAVPQMRAIARTVALADVTDVTRACPLAADESAAHRLLQRWDARPRARSALVWEGVFIVRANQAAALVAAGSLPTHQARHWLSFARDTLAARRPIAARALLARAARACSAGLDCGLEEAKLLRVAVEAEAAALEWHQGRLSLALSTAQRALAQMDALPQASAAENSVSQRNWCALRWRILHELCSWLSNAQLETSASVASLLSLALVAAGERETDDDSGADVAARVASVQYQLGRFHEARVRSLEVRVPELVDESTLDELSSLPHIQPHLKRVKEERDADVMAFEEALTGAWRAYVACLAADDQRNVELPYRLVRLAFRYHAHTALQRAVIAALPPAVKMLPVAPQLASRISVAAQGEWLLESLTLIYSSLLSALPFAALFPLLPLRGAQHVDALLLRARTSSDRTRAAIESVFSWEAVLCDVNQVASEIRKKCNTDHPRPSPEALRRLSPKLRDVSQTVQRLAVPLPWTASRADGGLFIVSVNEEPELLNGRSMPVALKLNASDGRTYAVALKAGEDLRQDAIVQQFFRLADSLLRSAPRDESGEEALSMRGYAALPLTSKLGIIELVPHTSSLRTLIGEAQSTGPALSSISLALRALFNSGSSVRAAPVADARAPVVTCIEPPRSQGGGEAQRGGHESLQLRVRTRARNEDPHSFALRGFGDLLALYGPSRLSRAMHCLFPDPQSWVSSHRAFSVSLAVGSIVGHAVGLGDRHLDNILLDVQSGEIVHIDLGVAFDLGELLPIPERVPFRLTPELCAALGVQGVAGRFRGACESTLRVLRAHQAELLTVLDVVGYDPLQRWRACPTRDDRWRDLASAAQRFTASRALQSARDKLAGLVRSEPLAPEAQARVLISAARDPALLAHMYYGWLPVV